MSSKREVIANLDYLNGLIEANDKKIDLSEVEEKFSFSEERLVEYVEDHLRNEEKRTSEYKAAQAILGFNKLLYIRLLLKNKKIKKAQKILKTFDKKTNPITYYLSYAACLFFNKEIENFNSELFEDILLDILDSSIWRLENYTDFEYFEKIDSIDNNDHKFLLLIFSFLVLRFLKTLNVEFDDEIERKVAHFTDVNVARLLINGDTKIRLSSTEFMNDPKEGELFFDMFGIEKQVDILDYEHSFLACFTFNHNSLNQFRLYGKLHEKECTGMSLVVDKSFFAELTNGYSTTRNESLPLFRCVYIDPISRYLEIAKRNKFSFYQEFSDISKSSSCEEIEQLWEEYSSGIVDKENILKDLLNDMQLAIDNLDLEAIQLLQHINKLVKPIQYLFKHFAFQEEQECRVVEVCSLKDDKVIADYDASKTFINYPLNMNESLVNIYIGKAIEKKSVSITKEILSLKLPKSPKIRLSENPFRNKD